MQPDDVTVLTLPDKAAWLKERLTGIGSSDAAAVVGVSPFKSALALYAEKIGLREPDAAETEAMEWGLRLEPVIADKYAEETGRPLRDPGRFTILRSVARPFLLATPDREVLTPNPHGAAGLLEIKTAGAYRADEWAEEPPVYYQVQLQHQLMVRGWAWGSLAVLIGGQRFLWVDIPRNDRFIALLLEREEEFWARIGRMDPPKPDADSNAFMAKLWPKPEEGKAVPLPADALEWDRARREAMEQMDRAKAVKDEAEALLKAALKDAEYGALPGGGRFSWKVESRAGYAVDPWSGRVLRRLKK